MTPDCTCYNAGLCPACREADASPGVPMNALDPATLATLALVAPAAPREENDHE